MAQEISDNFGLNANKHLDKRYGPWANLDVARAAIPIDYRVLGLTVGIMVNGEIKEYYWKARTSDTGLVEKLTGSIVPPPIPEGVELTIAPGSPIITDHDITETDAQVKVDGVVHDIPSLLITFGVTGAGKHRIDAVVIDLNSFTYVLVEGDEVLKTASAASPTIPLDSILVRYVTVTDGSISPISANYVQAIDVDGKNIYPDTKGVIRLPPSYTDEKAITAVATTTYTKAQVDAIVSAIGVKGISFVWADGAAQTAQTGMEEGSLALRQDENKVYRYNETLTTWEFLFDVAPDIPLATSANDGLMSKEDKASFGVNNVRTGQNASTTGDTNTASGTNSTARGNNSTASGLNSMASGISSRASGREAHAFGYLAKADGNYSFASNLNTNATGEASHAEGWLNTASGNVGSHAEGDTTIASGNGSHSENYQTRAIGPYSHAGGRRARAEGDGSFNHSTNSSSSDTSKGAIAPNSAVLGGTDGTVAAAATNSVTLGGVGLVNSTPNSVLVPKLIVQTGIILDGSGTPILGGGAGGAGSPPTTDASELVTGTLNDARLSSNVPLKNTANVFTERLEVQNLTYTQLAFKTSNTLGTDSYPRFGIRGDGLMAFGGGTTSEDVFLQRDAAGRLRVDGKLNARDGLQENGVDLSTKYALQVGTILYHSTKWFVPTGNATVFGATLTSVTSDYSQFTSAMVGSKLIINGESRIITGYSTTTLVTVDAPYSTNHSGSNWGVYSKAFAIAGDGNHQHFNTTGGLVETGGSGGGGGVAKVEFIYPDVSIDNVEEVYLDEPITIASVTKSGNIGSFTFFVKEDGGAYVNPAAPAVASYNDVNSWITANIADGDIYWIKVVQTRTSGAVNKGYVTFTLG